MGKDQERSSWSYFWRNKRERYPYPFLSPWYERTLTKGYFQSTPTSDRSRCSEHVSRAR